MVECLEAWTHGSTADIKGYKSEIKENLHVVHKHHRENRKFSRMLDIYSRVKLIDLMAVT